MASAEARKKCVSSTKLRDSAAVAAAMGYYGKVLSITGRNVAAIKILKEASELGAHYAGASSPLALQNGLFLGEAQSAAGDRTAARATATSMYGMALKQYGASHLLTLRAQMDLGKVQLSDDAPEAAQIQFVDVIAGLRKLGTQGEPHLARALMYLGEVQKRLGRTVEAEASLRESVALRERHPEDLWELAQARERLGEVTAGRDSSATTELLTTAARDLESQLGATHEETLRAKTALVELHVWSDDPQGDRLQHRPRPITGAELGENF